MRTPNIDAIMEMAQAYIDDKIDELTFELDFPYEVEQRYQKMVKEHSEYAELIFEYLVEEGAYRFGELSDSESKKLIKKNVRYIQGVVRDGFF